MTGRTVPATDTVPAITRDGVSKSFDGGAHFALREICLSIGPGDFVAMVGASGSGKTTLLKCINRLVEPDSGAILIDGRPVADSPPHDLRRHIGYVFQDIGLFPHLSVAENIGITPNLLGWSCEDITARISELLDLVELPADYGARMPDALSGGQRQRVGIARALAVRPPVLLMDEPFGALDPITRDTLGQACRRLHDTLSRHCHVNFVRAQQASARFAHVAAADAAIHSALATVLKRRMVLRETRWRWMLKVL